MVQRQQMTLLRGTSAAFYAKFTVWTGVVTLLITSSGTVLLVVMVPESIAVLWLLATVSSMLVTCLFSVLVYSRARKEALAGYSTVTGFYKELDLRDSATGALIAAGSRRNSSVTHRTPTRISHNEISTPSDLTRGGRPVNKAVSSGPGRWSRIGFSAFVLVQGILVVLGWIRAGDDSDRTLLLVGTATLTVSLVALVAFVVTARAIRTRVLARLAVESLRPKGLVRTGYLGSEGRTAVERFLLATSQSPERVRRPRTSIVIEVSNTELTLWEGVGPAPAKIMSVPKQHVEAFRAERVLLGSESHLGIVVELRFDGMAFDLGLVVCGGGRHGVRVLVAHELGLFERELQKLLEP